MSRLGVAWLELARLVAEAGPRDRFHCVEAPYPSKTNPNRVVAIGGVVDGRPERPAVILVGLADDDAEEDIGKAQLGVPTREHAAAVLAALRDAWPDLVPGREALERELAALKREKPAHDNDSCDVALAEGPHENACAACRLEHLELELRNWRLAHEVASGERDRLERERGEARRELERLRARMKPGRMLPVETFIAELQKIRDDFGNTCVYVVDVSWGAVALNRESGDRSAALNGTTQPEASP